MGTLMLTVVGPGVGWIVGVAVAEGVNVAVGALTGVGAGVSLELVAVGTLGDARGLVGARVGATALVAADSGGTGVELG